MSNAKQKTISDIVNEMRQAEATWHRSEIAQLPTQYLKEWSDRIEAAKRECEATSEKSSQVGNAASMREALKETKSVIEKCSNMLRYIPDGCEYDEILDEVADNLYDLQKTHVKPVLSAPPRNCDIGTTEEQYARVREFCKKHKVGLRCVDCPVNGLFPKNCALIWANMPYDKGDEDECK